MSKADWSFLEHLLEEGQEYSTAVGRIWLTVLFLFRMLVLGTAAESAWDDEQLDFVCNTRQPGCTAVCYDRAFPISHFRYFVLQVIFVSTPTIFYFGYVAIRNGKEKQKEEDGKQAEEGGSGSGSGGIVIQKESDTLKEVKEQGNSGGKGQKADKPPADVPKLKGRLLGAYAFSILLKVFLEVGFIVGLWFLYGGFVIVPKFECTGFPCPHVVDCFVSRPTEKTIFTVYIQVIAVISLLLNLVELLHLLQLAFAHRLEKRYKLEQLDYLPRAASPPPAPALHEAREHQAEVVQLHKESGQNGPPAQGEAPAYHDAAGEVSWGPGEAAGDLLPTYMNYMGAMATKQSPRVHYKKHGHHSGKHTKAGYKGHSRQKHYV